MGIGKIVIVGFVLYIAMVVTETEWLKRIHKIEQDAVYAEINATIRECNVMVAQMLKKMEPWS